MATTNNLRGLVIATYAILISSLLVSPLARKDGVSVVPLVLSIKRSNASYVSPLTPWTEAFVYSLWIFFSKKTFTGNSCKKTVFSMEKGMGIDFLRTMEFSYTIESGIVR